MTSRQASGAGAAVAEDGGRGVRERWRAVVLTPFGLYGAAVLRIGVAGLFLLNLLREAGHADRLWGPGSPYTPELFQASIEARGADGRLSWWYTWLGTPSPDYFWAAYVLAVAVSALYLLGWHTRLMAVLFAFVVAGFYMRSTVASSGFELLSLLFANYLVLCASGRRWSLDARRAARATAPPVTPYEELRRRGVTVLHNAGMALIAFQMMVVYGTAALCKIRGTTWRDGSALHYALRLDDFATFPELSGRLAGQGSGLALLAYVTLATQLLFPVLVFVPRLRYAVLGVMVGTHAGIGLLLALPMFSAITIVGDLVFLPTSFWLRAARAVRLPRSSHAAIP